MTWDRHDPAPIAVVLDGDDLFRGATRVDRTRTCECHCESYLTEPRAGSKPEADRRPVRQGVGYGVRGLFLVRKKPTQTKVGARLLGLSATNWHGLADEHAASRTVVRRTLSSELVSF
jgi:hypothetical protein